MASEVPTIQLDPKYDHYDFPTTSPINQSGHPGHTTPEQDAQVHQLRMTLEQAGYTERLDTLTLVRTQIPCYLLFRLTAVCSCDFYERASSMWHFQRRCMFTTPPPYCKPNIWTGLSTASNGVKTSTSMTSCETSNTKRKPKFSNTTLKIITRQIKCASRTPPGEGLR